MAFAAGVRGDVAIPVGNVSVFGGGFFEAGVDFGSTFAFLLLSSLL